MSIVIQLCTFGKKHSENQGWIGYYKDMLDEVTFAEYAENLGSESVWEYS